MKCLRYRDYNVEDIGIIKLEFVAKTQFLYFRFHESIIKKNNYQWQVGEGKGVVIASHTEHNIQFALNKNILIIC